MNRTFRPVVAALSAAFLFACGPALEDGAPEPLAEEVQTEQPDGLRPARVEDDSPRIKGGGKRGATEQSYAIRTTDRLSSSPSWGSRYSVENTSSLFFAIDVPDTTRGHHVATVFLTAPGGASYQRLDIAFTTDLIAADGEQQAERLSTGGFRVWASIPVSGTFIQYYALTGSWAADAHLDDSAEPASRTEFVLY